MRTGGRQKGTPNKLTEETRDLIEASLGASPLEKMAHLARDLIEGQRLADNESKAIEIATKLLSELAGYCAPKRRAVELSAVASESPPLVQVYIPDNGR